MGSFFSVPTKSRFIMTEEYPEDDLVAKAFSDTGIFRVKLMPPRVTLRMKYEMAMAPEIFLPFNLETHAPQHAINELMKLYNGGVRNCVLKLSENFSPDLWIDLCCTLDETLPGLMREVDESGRLRRLKVYFVEEIRSENSLNLASFLCVVVAVVLYWLLFKVYNGF